MADNTNGADTHAARVRRLAANKRLEISQEREKSMKDILAAVLAEVEHEAIRNGTTSLAITEMSYGTATDFNILWDACVNGTLVRDLESLGFSVTLRSSFTDLDTVIIDWSEPTSKVGNTFTIKMINFFTKLKEAFVRTRTYILFYLMFALAVAYIITKSIT